MYEVFFSNQAIKDIKKLKQSKLNTKAKALVEIIKQNPYQNPPPYERLVGNMQGFLSRRINIQHRLVYTVLEDKKVIKIYRMWTHYE